MKLRQYYIGEYFLFLLFFHGEEQQDVEEEVTTYQLFNSAQLSCVPSLSSSSALISNIGRLEKIFCKLFQVLYILWTFVICKRRFFHRKELCPSYSIINCYSSSSSLPLSYCSPNAGFSSVIFSLASSFNQVERDMTLSLHTRDTMNSFPLKIWLYYNFLHQHSIQ